MKKIVILTLLSLLSLEFLFAEKIIFSANSMTGKAGDSNTTTALSGNAYIRTETMEIQAENIQLSGEDYRNIKAAGSVIGKNLETNMEFTCDSLDYDRTTKVAQLQGNVDLQDKDNDVRAKAQIIVYNQETDIAILQISINLTQKENVCTGSYAVYYKKTKLLELSGNAQIKQKDDTFRAQFITLNMDTQDINLGGNVKGTVTDTKTIEEPATENNQENDTAAEDVKDNVESADDKKAEAEKDKEEKIQEDKKGN